MGRERLPSKLDLPLGDWRVAAERVDFRIGLGEAAGLAAEVGFGSGDEKRKFFRLFFRDCAVASSSSSDSTRFRFRRLAVGAIAKHARAGEAASVRSTIVLTWGL